MPLLGIPAHQPTKAGQIDLFHQELEATLATPSHHRAHHGANPQFPARDPTEADAGRRPVGAASGVVGTGVEGAG